MQHAETNVHERSSGAFDLQDFGLTAIVIVHHNCSDVLEACMASLGALDYPNHAAIVVESGSSADESARARGIAARAGALFVVSPENGGFAAGCNIGIRHARYLGAEFVWLLNPDTTVEPAALSSLVRVVSSSSAPAICGSKVLYAPEEVFQQSGFAAPARIWGIGGAIDREHRQVAMRGSGESDCGQYDSLSPCDYIPGCSMLARLATFEHVGRLDERYFLYFEETDWCVRARRLGCALLIEPKSVVWHHFDDSKLNTPATTYYYNRSRLRFWRSMLPFREKVTLVARTAFRDLPDAIRARKAAGDDAMRRLFLAHSCAYRDFLLGRGGPWRG